MTETPGQVAYKAYCRCEYGPYIARPDGPLTWGWSLLLDTEQAAWEAAAEAVRMQYKEEMADAWQSGQAVWTQRALDHPAQAALDAAPDSRKEP